MLIGYARASTQDQNLELQLDALRAAGCEKVFEDKTSGTRTARPGLDQILEHARQGDTVVVSRLDRLGRSMRRLLIVVSDLEKRGVGFRSLQKPIDTTSSGGDPIFHIFRASAEFERSLIQERTQEGLSAARARGRHGGRALTPICSDRFGAYNWIERRGYCWAHLKRALQAMAERFGSKWCGCRFVAGAKCVKTA